MTKLFLDIDNPYANNTMYNDIMHSDSYSLPTANLSHCARYSYQPISESKMTIIVHYSVVGRVQV